MGVDKMNSYDEPTIYNLLTVEETKEKKPKAYTSKFRQNVKEEYTSGRGGHKTMGPAKVNAPQPTDYLKKHDKEPKLPGKKFVDTKNGDVQNLIPSGYEPVFVHKKEYGEVPMYLSKRKEEVKRAQEEYDQYISEQIRRTALRQLTYDERQAIIDGLKANWEDIQDQYQGLSVVTDTAPKKNRKERMEAQMKQLERDIELFEKHKIIYIGN